MIATQGNVIKVHLPHNIKLALIKRRSVLNYFSHLMTQTIREVHNNKTVSRIFYIITEYKTGNTINRILHLNKHNCERCSSFASTNVLALFYKRLKQNGLLLKNSLLGCLWVRCLVLGKYSE